MRESGIGRPSFVRARKDYCNDTPIVAKFVFQTEVIVARHRLVPASDVSTPVSVYLTCPEIELIGLVRKLR